MKSNTTNKRMRPAMRMRNRMTVVQKMTWVVADVLSLSVLVGLAIYLQFAKVDNVANITSGDFRTKTSGNWNSTGTWQKFNGAKWEDATSVPSSANGTIEIRQGHTISVNTNITIDQTVIESGGTIECQPGRYLIIDDGPGTDLIVKGTLSIFNGSFLTQIASSAVELTGSLSMAVGSSQEIASEATLTINDGGTFINDGGNLAVAPNKWIINTGGKYKSAINGDIIPKAVWKDGSICEITGVTTKIPSNLNQSFADFVWDCPEQSALVNLAGKITNVNGDFSFISSGNGAVGLSNAENCTLNVGGDFHMKGGDFFQCTAAKKSVIEIAGNFIQTGGVFSGTKIMNGGLADGTPTINVKGDYYISGGTFDMSQNNSAANGSGICSFNLSGDFIQRGGTLTQTAAQTDLTNGNFGFGKINFNKQGKQIFSRKSGVITNAVSFQVNNGSVLDLGTSFPVGKGTFIVADGGGLLIGSPAGITATSSNGNIQVNGGRVLSTKGNYTYNGTSAQVTGDGLPAEVNNLAINNNHHLTLSNKVAVNGSLVLEKGQIITGAQEIAVNNTDKSAVSGYSEESYVRGNLRRQVKSTGTYDFPLGTASNYEFVNINLSGISGCSSILGTFNNVNPGGNSASLAGITVNGSTVDALLNYGYWTLTPNATVSSGTYSVTLKESGHSRPAGNADNYCVLTKTSKSTPWQSQGTHLSAAQNEAEGTAIASRSSLNTFGNYAIGLSNGNTEAIAAKSINFNAKINNEIVELAWSVKAEDNNNYFTIERSSDGVHFESLLNKQGTGSSSSLNYSDLDSRPLAGYSFYRLKQTDKSGRTSYSEIKRVQKNVGGEQIASSLKLKSISPNPFGESFTIAFEMKVNAPVNFQMLNSSGQVVLEKVINAIDGLNKLEFKDEKGLPGGIYVAVLTYRDEKATQKVLKK